MDTYTAQAEIWNADRQLVAAVVAEVAREGDEWWGVLTVEANTINWVGQDLTLHMDGHPAGPILIHKEPLTRLAESCSSTSEDRGCRRSGQTGRKVSLLKSFGTGNLWSGLKYRIGA